MSASAEARASNRQRTPTPLEYLRARAHVAQRLVREHLLGPEDALAYAVWPTAEIEDAELATPNGTIANRACAQKLNR